MERLCYLPSWRMHVFVHNFIAISKIYTFNKAFQHFYYACPFTTKSEPSRILDHLWSCHCHNSKEAPRGSMYCPHRSVHVSMNTTSSYHNEDLNCEVQVFAFLSQFRPQTFSISGSTIYEKFWNKFQKQYVKTEAAKSSHFSGLLNHTLLATRTVFSFS